jgi:hypothetical protein
MATFSATAENVPAGEGQMDKPIYYNVYGEPRPWSELVAKFGAVVVHRAPAQAGDVVWQCIGLLERRDIPAERVHMMQPWVARHLERVNRVTDRSQPDAAAAIVVTHELLGGGAAIGLRAAWYWPDAPEDPDCGPVGGVPAGMTPGRAVSGLTNDNGDIGHAMGRGAYYWPDQGQIGPHAVWVYGTSVQSDVILGLGMIGETNHDHLDVFYRQVAETPPGPPEPPAPPEPPEPPGMLYFDEQGQPQVLAWAVDLFGDQEIHDPGVLPRYAVAELHASSGTHLAFAPRVLDTDGNPVAGITVAIGPRDVSGVTERRETNTDGYATFSLAGRERHTVPGQGHYVCGLPDAPCEVYNAAGAVAGVSPPRWLNPVFVWRDDVAPPEPPGPGVWDLIEERLDAIEAQAAAIRMLRPPSLR